MQQKSRNFCLIFDRACSPFITVPLDSLADTTPKATIYRSQTFVLTIICKFDACRQDAQPMLRGLTVLK